MKIDGKTIWITGASSGIGEALAYHLAQKNCKLILSSRNEDELNRVKANCITPENIAVLILDLGDFEGMEAKTEKALSAFGAIDILINNAGLSQRSLIAETSFKVYKKLIDVNYLGTIALTKALLPYFIRQKGGIFVTTTSLMGKFSSPYRSGYCGAKHALHGFFDALRLEHEKDGIGVTMICPGFVNTNVAQNALTANGDAQNSQDSATENGIDPAVFATKMTRAIERKKFEAYIGGKEALVTYLRIFPKLMHRIISRSTVR